jgi:hypothetical protein
MSDEAKGSEVMFKRRIKNDVAKAITSVAASIVEEERMASSRSINYTFNHDEATAPAQSSERVARGHSTSPLSRSANQGRRPGA